MNQLCTLTVIDPRYPRRRPLAVHAELTSDVAREISAVYLALGYSSDCIVVEVERITEAA
jgi:hypothetical protein